MGVEERINELSPDLLGVAAMNPFLMHDSSSRLAMFCSHIGQSLVIQDSTVKRTLSGVEREYAKYTHAIRMPCNAIVIKLVQKYPKTLGLDNVKENPYTALIYENVDSPRREIGMLELETHHCIHQYFGFKYRYRPEIINQLVPGHHIPKGTVIADSPSVTEDGDYKPGLEAQIALMTLPAVIEDGIIASDAFLKRCRTKAFGSRVVSFGKNRFPLNLYGSATQYKPFPDIGDKIRSDGLLFSLRNYDELLAVTNMSPRALRTPSDFDRATYAPPNAKIVDIIVHKGSNLRANLPTGMADQCVKYYNKTRHYHEALLHEYQSLRSKKKEALHLSPRFDRALVESMAILGTGGKDRVIHTMNGAPIDEWWVEVVFEYDIEPTIGFKFTDFHGGKGIIVDVMKEEDMPIDAHGNRAEIIMDDFSTIKRMNLGRLVEQLINASGRATAKRTEQLLGTRTQPEIDRAWEYLTGFYKIVSPRHHEAIYAAGIDKRKLEHLEDVAKDGIYLFTPTDTPVSYVDVARTLREKYPPCYGPVMYRGKSGNQITTKRPIMIGGLYMLMLEKIGNTVAAVASARLQHFGIPAKLTNADKYSGPGREQPVRILGESEVRLFSTVVGGDTTAEILDQTNNPEAHKHILNTIYHAEKPTNITNVIDRTIIPRGKGRVVSYVRHMAECAGFEFVDGGKI